MTARPAHVVPTPRPHRSRRCAPQAGRVVVTVTLNAALDITYHLAGRTVTGETNRVSTVDERAGGKGVNVARVLHTLGTPVVATGFVGGPTGTEIRDLLAREGVWHSFVDIAGRSRRTVVVTDPAGTTGLWEPGPLVRPAEWHAFTDRYRELLAPAGVVVLSGSLPRGLPVDAYAHLIRLATHAGVPAILDSDGEPLRAGLSARPALVKPNAAELAAVTGRPAPDAGTPRPRQAVTAALQAAAALRGVAAPPGCRDTAVVASLGRYGLVLVSRTGRWHAALPTALPGNPTGAGDACVAALARAMARGLPGEVAVRDAVAVSAAAVLAPVAGTVSRTDVSRLRRAVRVRRI